MSQAVEAYRGITATDEFKYLEYLRERTGHDEAQALMNARRKEKEKWQNVVAGKDSIIADKDSVIADKEARIAELEAQLKKEF